jgi:hypothetical protein
LRARIMSCRRRSLTLGRVTDRDGNRKDGGEKRGEYAAIGIDADLREASRKALRGLIGWLEAEKGLSRAEAYSKFFLSLFSRHSFHWGDGINVLSNPVTCLFVPISTQGERLTQTRKCWRQSRQT